jgi:phosphoribosylformylglycinamidine cyclo-ligase
MAEHTYKTAGVDLDAAREAKRRIRSVVAGTHGPQVIGGIGGFGAMYRLSGYREPVLVSSTDGVGTKIRLAIALGRYEALGEDVVNACVNDVVVCGAKPLFFLDYIAMGTLVPDTVEALARGMAKACEAAGCALIGGETAEMPGMYGEGDFDLAGFVVGAVEKSAMLDVSTVGKGDLLLGLPSSGLHTNGFSLVRRILGLDEDTSALWEFHQELGRTLGEELLEPHRSYYPLVEPVMGLVKGMAHVTGGGLIENVPRALPEGLGARLDTGSWKLPAIFTILQERGNVAWEEMYRVYNMGLGLVLVCDPARADEVMSLLPEARVVGEVTDVLGDRRVVL